MKGYIGEGVYTVPEAARLTGVKTQTIYRWLFGGSLSSYQNRKIESHKSVIIHTFDVLDSVANLSFSDLIQVRLIQKFRDRGISLQTIRKAAENAARILNNPHPFCSARFRTDGDRLLAEVSENDGRLTLVELQNLQQVFREVIEPFLQGLEYDDEFVARWYPKKGDHLVVIDPERNFGQPVLAREGVPTQSLYQAYKSSHGDSAKVAHWYEIPEPSVKAAVRFEESLAA